MNIDYLKNYGLKCQIILHPDDEKKIEAWQQSASKFWNEVNWDVYVAREYYKPKEGEPPLELNFPEVAENMAKSPHSHKSLTYAMKHFRRQHEDCPPACILMGTSKSLAMAWQIYKEFQQGKRPHLRNALNKKKAMGRNVRHFAKPRMVKKVSKDPVVYEWKPLRFFNVGRQLVNVERRELEIPGLGRRTIKLRGVFPDGICDGFTIDKTPYGWQVSLQFKNANHLTVATHPRPNTDVGVDVGVVNYISLSNGMEVAGIDTKRMEQRIDRLKSVRDKKKRGSKNWKRLHSKIARLHRKLAEFRNHTAHYWSKHLATHYEHVVMEDINMRITASAKGTEETPGKNVRQKAGLNKAILRQSWGSLFEKTETKCGIYAGKFTQVNPAGTSSAIPCPECSAPMNRKSQAVVVCPSCAFTSNKCDVLAAGEILRRGREPAKKKGKKKAS